MTEKYTFGDSPIAVRRLELLHQVFENSSRNFLNEVVSRKPGLAVDLGCGPGYSTRLLAEALSPARTVGLDNSDSFISLADESGIDSAFYLHDVTSVPFPETGADVIYCRFLLTHLARPKEIIDRWATQLASQGLLLIEETEAIHTRNPVFAKYEEIVAAMIASEGGRLFIGPALENLDFGSLEKMYSKVTQVTAATGLAASMFALNIEAWKDRSFIRDNYTQREIEDLAAEMQALTKNDDTGEITWEMRQIAFKRE